MFWWLIPRSMTWYIPESDVMRGGRGQVPDTGADTGNQILCMNPRPIPVSLSNWRCDAPQFFSSFIVFRIVLSSSCWNALLLVTPVFSFICCHTWSSESLIFGFSLSLSRLMKSSGRGSLTMAAKSSKGILLRTVDTEDSVNVASVFSPGAIFIVLDVLYNACFHRILVYVT